MYDLSRYSARPGVPQTTAKAQAAGITTSLTTLAVYAVARWWDVIPAPPVPFVIEAGVALIGAAVTGASGFISAWWAKNKPV